VCQRKGEHEEESYGLVFGKRLDRAMVDFGMVRGREREGRGWKERENHFGCTLSCIHGYCKTGEIMLVFVMNESGRMRFLSTHITHFSGRKCFIYVSQLQRLLLKIHKRCWRRPVY
jgi:hypothetical protein